LIAFSNLFFGVLIDKTIIVLAFAGSLKKDSYNKALIRTALEVTPENVAIEIFKLECIQHWHDGV
jgi:chromate reductase